MRTHCYVCSYIADIHYGKRTQHSKKHPFSHDFHRLKFNYIRDSLDSLYITTLPLSNLVLLLIDMKVLKLNVAALFMQATLLRKSLAQNTVAHICILYIARIQGYFIHSFLSRTFSSRALSTFHSFIILLAWNHEPKILSASTLQVGHFHRRSSLSYLILLSPQAG